MHVFGSAYLGLGFAMRYNTVKQHVVREIYDRMFRDAGVA